MHNWNRDAVLIDQSLKIRFEFDILSRIEFDWRLLEQLLALLIDLSIGDAGVFSMALNVVLVLSRLIDLLLLDSPDHFFFFNVEVFQLSAELHFLIVIEFDQLLSLVFFELSSLLNHLVFLILYSVISISLRFQVNFSSLPKQFLLSLCDDVEASFLCFVYHLFHLWRFVEKMLVFLNCSLNTLIVWFATIAALAHILFNLG